MIARRAAGGARAVAQPIAQAIARIVALGAVIAACAAQPARSVELPAASAPGPGPEMTPMPGDPHAQIQQLDDQITDELARGGVAPPAPAACSGPGCAQAMSQPFATPVAPSYDAACHPASTGKCTDACTLSTSICGNQDKICALARQLAGDDWAANKCTTARASCQAAHDHCCSCM